MQRLTIFSEAAEAPRVKYTMEVLFGHLLSCSYDLTADRGRYFQAKGARLNYGARRFDAEEVFIPAGPLLRERGIQPQVLQVVPVEDLPAFFHQEVRGADLPFDLPAMIFFLLSRYEEYLPFQPDTHGRFPAAASLAFNNNFLEFPLANLWADRLAQLVRRRFPAWSPPSSTYRFLPTYDIDLAWAYLFRPPWRTALATARDLVRQDWGAIRQRLAVLSGRALDPFATAFQWLADLHQQLPARAIFFFLLAGFGPYDRGVSFRSERLQHLIRELSVTHQIGIHPSYRSSQRENLLGKEIGRLAAITGQPVTQSRQHFLRLNFPGTYRALIENGIQTDHTMGFADAIGFRASVATPYPWYDLPRETKTPLMIWPFQVMDVTLMNYLRLAPEDALRAVRLLIERTHQVGGTFTTLWHNSSLTDEAWRKMYRQVYQEAFSREKT